MPHHYSPGMFCCLMSIKHGAKFVRNSSTPFKYNLNFTNSTTSALFTLTAPYGVVTMYFSGARVDDLYNHGLDSFNPYDNGNYTASALNSSNPKAPGFMFANGSRIEFGGDVAFASQSSSGVQAEAMQWIARLSLIIAGIASFVIFF
jgi:hypothetical protein